jgi:hypothetical protein
VDPNLKWIRQQSQADDGYIDQSSDVYVHPHSPSRLIFVWKTPVFHGDNEISQSLRNALDKASRAFKLEPDIPFQAPAVLNRAPNQDARSRRHERSDNARRTAVAYQFLEQEYATMEIEAEGLATSSLRDAYGAGVEEEWDPAKMLLRENNNKQRYKKKQTGSSHDCSSSDSSSNGDYGIPSIPRRSHPYAPCPSDTSSTRHRKRNANKDMVDFARRIQMKFSKGTHRRGPRATRAQGARYPFAAPTFSEYYLSENMLYIAWGIPECRK